MADAVEQAKPSRRAALAPAREPDELDRRIINALQGDFPLSPEPYAEAAARLGISEAELLARLQSLLDDRILTRFGPMFQIERLGGAFCLAAMAVPVMQVTSQRAKESELRLALRQLREGIDTYKRYSDEGRIARPADGNGYPPSLQALVEGGYDFLLTFHHPSVPNPLDPERFPHKVIGRDGLAAVASPGLAAQAAAAQAAVTKESDGNTPAGGAR